MLTLSLQNSTVKEQRPRVVALLQVRRNVSHLDIVGYADWQPSHCLVLTLLLTCEGTEVQCLVLPMVSRNDLF